jgi:hypothetical protein
MLTIPHHLLRSSLFVTWGAVPFLLHYTNEGLWDCDGCTRCDDNNSDVSTAARDWTVHVSCTRQGIGYWHMHSLIHAHVWASPTLVTQLEW